MEAIIFAAGFGTRLGVLTKDKPKALMEVAGKTLLEHNIGYLRKYGVSRFIINVHYKAEQIIDFLYKNKGFGLPYRVVWERGLEPLETGGGLENAELLFAEQQDFLTLNADILTDVDLSALYAHHKRQNNLISLVVGTRPAVRGLFFNSRQELQAWGNLHSGECRGKGIENTKFLPFWGITMCNFRVFQKRRELKLDLGRNVENLPRYSLLDLWLALADKGEKIGAFIVENPENMRFCDVGTPQNFARAQSLFAD